MTIVDGLIALAAMGVVLPIVISPFLLTPFLLGSVASGTYVMAEGASPAGFKRWLAFLAAIPVAAILSAGFLMFVILA